MKPKLTALMLAFAIGASMLAPMAITGDQIASAATVKKQRKKAPPSNRYRNENMPGTNFRAARPEEYPRIHGGDCDLWQFGRSLFECEAYFFHPRRNPATR